MRSRAAIGDKEFGRRFGSVDPAEDEEDRRVMVERGILVADPAGTETVRGREYRYADPEYKPGAFPDTVDEKSIKDAGGGLLVNSHLSWVPSTPKCLGIHAQVLGHPRPSAWASAPLPRPPPEFQTASFGRNSDLAMAR